MQALGLIVGCTTTVRDSNSQLLQTDSKLIEFQQIKTAELNQINVELAKLQSEIAEKQREYDKQMSVISMASERLSRKLGQTVNIQSFPYNTMMTSEELTADHKAASISQELSKLRQREKPLLFTKHYLEQDTNELVQYTSLQQYYQFKLSQLEKHETKLVKMQLDWEQKLVVGGYSLERSSKHPPDYDMALLERQLLQQDIKQLEQLLR